MSAFGWRLGKGNVAFVNPMRTGASNASAAMASSTVLYVISAVNTRRSLLNTGNTLKIQHINALHCNKQTHAHCCYLRFLLLSARMLEIVATVVVVVVVDDDVLVSAV